MSKVFAIIVDGVVNNVALFESLEQAQAGVGEGVTLVEILEGQRNPEIHGTWDGENFHPAPVVEEPVTELPAE